MNPFSWTPLILQTLVYPFTWIGLGFFARIRVYGRENLRGMKQGAIFAVNHSSELDPILIPATLRPLSRLMPMFYLARERSFYPNAQKGGLSKYFYGGLFFKIWGAYPAVVGTGDYELALKHHIRILGHGKSITIFPEGKKTRDGKIGEGKSGVSYLLWSTGVPVIPVAIHGHYQMNAGDFFSRKHTIAVSYGKPITRAELFGPDADRIPPTHEDLKTATHVIMSRIREMYEKI